MHANELLINAKWFSVREWIIFEQKWLKLSVSDQFVKSAKFLRFQSFWYNFAR
jgi:hypothetical protein